MGSWDLLGGSNKPQNNIIPGQGYLSGTNNGRRACLVMGSDGLTGALELVSTGTGGSAGAYTITFSSIGTVVAGMGIAGPGLGVGSTRTVASTSGGVTVQLDAASPAPTGGTYYFFGTTPTNSDVCERFGFTVPSTSGAPVNRFRLRIRNASLLANAFIPGSITLVGAYLGVANQSGETAWQGDFTAAPTSLGLSGAVEMGSSEYVSPWIYPSTATLTPDEFLGLSLGFTCSGVKVSTGPTPGWSWVGTGSSAAASAAAAPGTTPQPLTSYLDIRLEYEFNGNNQIGFYVGDSITNGYLNNSTAQGHMGPDDSWPQMAALRLGHHALNGGVGGAQAGVPWTKSAGGTSTPAQSWCWARFFNPDTSGNGANYTGFACTPDYATVALGVNDAIDTGLAAGVGLSTYQTNIGTICTDLTGFGIPRVYGVTATPGNTVAGTFAPAFQAGALDTPLSAAVPAQISISAPAGPGIGQPGTALCWVETTSNIYFGNPQNPITNGGPLPVTAALAVTQTPAPMSAATAVAIGGSSGAYTVTITSPSADDAWCKVGDVITATATSGTGSWTTLLKGAAMVVTAITATTVVATYIGTVAPVVTVFTSASFAVISGNQGRNFVQLSVTGSGNVTAATGTPVLTASEYQRQQFNQWIRTLPPCFQAIIDFDADVTTQYYYPSCTGRQEYYNNSGQIHPTGCGMYTQLASRFVNGILGN